MPTVLIQLDCMHTVCASNWFLSPRLSRYSHVQLAFVTTYRTQSSTTYLGVQLHGYQRGLGSNTEPRVRPPLVDAGQVGRYLLQNHWNFSGSVPEKLCSGLMPGLWRNTGQGSTEPVDYGNAQSCMDTVQQTLGYTNCINESSSYRQITHRVTCIRNNIKDVSQSGLTYMLHY